MSLPLPMIPRMMGLGQRKGKRTQYHVGAVVESWSRARFYKLSVGTVVVVGVAGWFWHPVLWAYVVVLPVVGLGLHDALQTTKTIRRNFPLVGRIRYLFESIGPEIRQYFVETDLDGRPFPREKRSVVYQRAKATLDTLPFGTRADVYRVGYEWINHTLHPVEPDADGDRVMVGNEQCARPYHASLFNISAMSFGSLSATAVAALNLGANLGKFYHNTGEGGISPYHLQYNGDLVWQVGTAYFGCRKPDGSFCPDTFQKNATLPQVKMIELKLSQGAKPAHGGILPATKVTPEIADIRLVNLGADIVSPPAHSTFHTPVGLLEFLAKLRELSGGKPVGFKLCLGDRSEFFSICKAMLKTGIVPDFITVDGAEGGTGAAPLEFSNSVGVPLNDGLSFVHNALMGISLRSKIKIIAAGKITTGFHMLVKLALGADLCNSARGMMFALGCIQALKCNSNLCPSGVATQDPGLAAGLSVEHKGKRVANFHRKTIESAMSLLGACGLRRSEELLPSHIWRRIDLSEIKRLCDIYPFIAAKSLLQKPFPEKFAKAWDEADPDRF